MERMRNQWRGLQESYKVHQLALLNLQSGPYPTDFCIYGARSIFRTPLISIDGSSLFLMTLNWLGTVEDGRYWNWCLGITGGHRCQGMLAGTSPPVTCAFGPNHSNILQPEKSTPFPFHLLHGTPSVWTSLSSCHNLQGTIPSWLLSILSPSMHISFPLSQ